MSAKTSQPLNKQVKEPKKQGGSKKSNEVDVSQMTLDKTLVNFWNKYSVETHPRIKTIDWFILFLITIMAVQFFYRIVVGDDFPKNAFLVGLFSPLGVIVLLVQLRKSGEKKNFRKLGQFFVACLVLFLVSINFIG